MTVWAQRWKRAAKRHRKSNHEHMREKIGRLLAHQDPGKMAEQLALAVAWLEAEDRFQAEIYDTPQGRLPVWPEVIEAREAFRQSLQSGEGEK